MNGKKNDAFPPVTVCILAAGLSRRMGPVNKLLLEYAGQPLVRHVVCQALAAEVGDVHVVTGHEAPRIRQALKGLPVNYVHNLAYEEGLGASVRQAAAVNETAPLMVVLGDMPGVDASLLQRLVKALHDYSIEHDPSHLVVRPVYQGRGGNPVVWGCGWLPRLRRLAGDEGARSLLAGHTGPVITVEAGSEGIFADVDLPSDLPRFKMHYPV